MYRAYYESEIGLLEITANDEGIISVIFVEERKEENKNQIVEQCIAELDEYFNQQRTEFTVPLSAVGTPFQKKVWDALYTIPYGVSVSYLNIGEKIDNIKAVRAIGGANSRNPISIIVPCHRVIGKNGKLVGYAGGLWRKEWLLKHEGILK
ncbi:methylated-DNA--[protein]-cysteine S-methyltransferase [Bacillus sp. C1]